VTPPLFRPQHLYSLAAQGQLLHKHCVSQITATQLLVLQLIIILQVQQRS